MINDIIIQHPEKNFDCLATGCRTESRGKKKNLSNQPRRGDDAILHLRDKADQYEASDSEEFPT
jgi:hypothetical protein